MVDGSMTLGDTYVCTTVELIYLIIKNKKTEDYVHKYNGRPFREKKKSYKIINITVAESAKKKSTILQSKTYILLTFPTIKIKIKYGK